MQFAAGLLLQRGGHERRIGAAGVRLLLHGGHRHLLALQRVCQCLGALLVHHNHIGGQLTAVVEVTALRHTLAINGGQTRAERGGVIRIRLRGGITAELGGQIPIIRGDERHALTFPLDYDTGGHRLDTTSRQARHDLLPQHRGNLITVKTVEDTAGFLRIHQVHIQLTGVLHRGEDRRLGDLVEHHAAHRHLGLEHLEQMPGDGLTLTVGVCGQQKLIAFLELGLEVCDLLLLIWADHIQRGETVLGVHTEACPGFLLVLRWDICGTTWKITDVTDRGFNDVVVTQVRLDLACLGRRLHDDQTLLPRSLLFCHGAASLSLTPMTPDGFRGHCFYVVVH